jgi:hypothetical protein
MIGTTPHLEALKRLIVVGDDIIKKQPGTSTAMIERMTDWRREAAKVIG